MLNFLAENWGTILIGIILLGIISAIVVKLARDKRKGKSPGCGCGCGECLYSDKCNTK